MSTKPSLKSFLSPKSVAIIGASSQDGKFGHQILKNLKTIGYKGKIYPINKNSKENILGFKTYKSFDLLPEKPDLVVIVLPPKEIINVVNKCVQKFGIRNIMLESSFISEENETYLRKLSCEMGFRIMGSNSIGLINFNDRFSTSIIPVRCMLYDQENKSYKIGYLAQSGGLAGGCGWWDPYVGIGFSKVIHLGKSCDVNESEMIEYLVNDPNTEVITLYLNKISDRIIKTVEKYSKQKPIIYLKMNNSDPFKKMDDAGAIPAENYQELFDLAKAFIQAPIFKGENIGIIGPSSGALSLITCKLKDFGFKLAKNLREETKKNLREKVLNVQAKIYNPVDYWPPTRFDGKEVGEKYRIASEALLSDPDVDALILVFELFKEIEFDVIETLKGLKEKYPKKPIVAACVQVEQEVLNRILIGLGKLNILTYEFHIERSLKALWALKDFYKLKNT
ncbi:MAG: CoA-binding protein [Candidatus Helarchaeota archaeon]